ncbi:thiol peroxidase [Erysipelothrix larvae]|uniref:Thiol peroxidase n=1 Tax=Erysipelothrix larvae TaxID=1514105 RepID=A0A0X8H0B9_9FIRM|nr:thiol peroxidase [Erysipelothrix larvae]AMC93712.1 thiol peroxidase [Erysipelothrix larvae]
MEITRKGVPTQVEGVQPKVGDVAPKFTLKDLNNNTVSLDDFLGKKVLISVFPDINTRVCDLQTVHFFNLAGSLENTQIINISNNTQDDLKSWCATKNVDALMLHDDDKTFANAYGLWIPEFEVLARSVFVVDEEGKLAYVEIVPEMATEPNYEPAINACKA